MESPGRDLRGRATASFLVVEVTPKGHEGEIHSDNPSLAPQKKKIAIAFLGILAIGLKGDSYRWACCTDGVCGYCCVF